MKLYTYIKSNSDNKRNQILLSENDIATILCQHAWIILKDRMHPYQYYITISSDGKALFQNTDEHVYDCRWHIEKDEIIVLFGQEGYIFQPLFFDGDKLLILRYKNTLVVLYSASEIQSIRDLKSHSMKKYVDYSWVRIEQLFYHIEEAYSKEYFQLMITRFLDELHGYVQYLYPSYKKECVKSLWNGFLVTCFGIPFIYAATLFSPSRFWSDIGDVLMFVFLLILGLGLIGLGVSSGIVYLLPRTFYNHIKESIPVHERKILKMIDDKKVYKTIFKAIKDLRHHHSHDSIFGIRSTKL